MSTITVKNAVKKFKNSTVIDNVSLTLEGGNIYGFVGRNGSGKTMLFRAISGLIHLTSVFTYNSNYSTHKITLCLFSCTHKELSAFYH